MYSYVLIIALNRHYDSYILLQGFLAIGILQTVYWLFYTVDYRTLKIINFLKQIEPISISQAISHQSVVRESLGQRLKVIDNRCSRSNQYTATQVDLGITCFG